MRTTLVMLCGILLVAGCAHRQGGTADDYYKGYGTRMSETNQASPPLNPNDARDPTGLSVPLRVPPS